MPAPLKKHPLARPSPDPALKEVSNTPFNLMRLLRSGGGSLKDAKAVLQAIGPQGACMGPFDHAILYGKHRAGPLLLTGAPYQLLEEDMILLGRIVALGLEVHIGQESSYGFGTLDVRVYRAKSRLRRLRLTS